jgi:hypothetical protein
MKRLHKLSLIMACFTLLLLGNSAFAAKKKYDPGFLVVATAPSGTINQLANGNYSLTFALPKAGQVLVYTERPLKTHFVISDKVLNRLWAAGPNSFTKNPPSATLSLEPGHVPGYETAMLVGGMLFLGLLWLIGLAGVKMLALKPQQQAKKIQTLFIVWISLLVLVFLIMLYVMTNFVR